MLPDEVVPLGPRDRFRRAAADGISSGCIRVIVQLSSLIICRTAVLLVRRFVRRRVRDCGGGGGERRRSRRGGGTSIRRDSPRFGSAERRPGLQSRSDGFERGRVSMQGPRAEDRQPERQVGRDPARCQRSLRATGGAPDESRLYNMSRQSRCRSCSWSLAPALHNRGGDSRQIALASSRQSGRDPD